MTHSKLPGITGALIIASIAFLLAHHLPLIGSSVLALFIGLLLNLTIKDQKHYDTGLYFCSKTLLKVSIVLLGAGLSIHQIISVGRYSLYVMVFTLLAAFGFGHLLGKVLHVNWKMSTLISAGTGICGGSAIAALSPVIEAEDSDISYSIASTFIFDMVMILLFPIMGKMLGLSDLAYGLWAGTAVNDTSSVVAAGYAFSNQAGEFATIVKLTRTLSIVPIILIFSAIHSRQKSAQNTDLGYEKISAQKNGDSKLYHYIINIFPWFILMFLAMAGLNSMGMIPVALAHALKNASKFLMAMSLAAIGLKTDLHKMMASGTQPLVLGFLISTIVVIVSLLAQFSIGQI